MFDTDVFVLGGGPAGLATAIAARRHGFTVTLADAGQPPIDKPCGEGLMPDSLAAAAQLGLSIPEGQGFPFRGIRFASPPHTVAAHFPRGAGLGLRRTVLHSILIQAAANAGVQMLWGHSASGIDGHTVRLQRQSIGARWIVGADGAQSMVRRWAGLSTVRSESRRFGFRAHYPMAPWSPYMEIHWADGCQFYLTPVAPDEVCLVLMSRNPHLRIADALPRFPALQERLRNVSSATPERGAFAGTRRLKRITQRHIALVGDASGTVDAITGEGVCLAFQQAIALAAALEEGALSRYETEHARLSRRPLFMGRFMLMLDRSAWLRRRALNALATRPDLFANLLAAHVGLLKAPQFAATAATLGWEIATA